MQRQEAGGLYLVNHWLKLTRPVVVTADRRWHLLESEVLQHSALVQPPVHQHLVQAITKISYVLALGDDAVLVGVAGHE